MRHLYQELTDHVVAWREAGYPCEQYPVIGEIFDWAHETETGTLRFLRRPQLRALETYWYLRLVKNTPHVFDLYRQLYSKQSELLSALGLDHDEVKSFVLDHGLEALWARIRTDDAFVRDFKLEALRETLTLDYPSYILALAMGAGKTILIGAIIATEFAMALEYPEGPFVQNALVFAPGKTIIESLRELLEVPYEKIVPPRFFKTFAATVKLTFTRDGEKYIPVTRGSAFNIVVTNTEKIRIQKDTVRKGDLGRLFSPASEEEVRTEIANLRLQAIASLPHLAVFSDEAHHTYGQSLGAELKKVRKTVDYLAGVTNVVCVVNTTGTPYFQRQPLRDVVAWYGLSDGISDGILKDLAGNIQAYDFSGDAGKYVAHVVEDFFRDYGEVRLPNGAAAKLAVYFPQTDDLRELRPVIDTTLVRAGLSPSLCLVNTSDETLTKQTDIDAFNRLNDPTAPHRLLLVNKGTEGWNCPSLFACALARKLKSANNFVLQAATRCLRQVPGNTVKARVYLSSDNFTALDRELKETYGESIADLSRSGNESRHERIVLRKLDLPPLVVTQVVRTVIRRASGPRPLRLQRPDAATIDVLTKQVFTIAEQEAAHRLLRQVGDTLTIEGEPDATDAYAAAVDLTARYRLDLWEVYDELRRLYAVEGIPRLHVSGLAEQIEKQTGNYEVREEHVERGLALVKPEGFIRELDASGAEIYTADIAYPKDHEALLARLNVWKDKTGRFGFHYDPYNFDSQPELSFFEEMLTHLKVKPDEVDDIYFTGALTDPNKTDFFVEYKDDKDKWRRYTPDFVIRRKDGKCLIVEIKDARFEAATNEDLRRAEHGETVLTVEGRKAMALRKWESLNPARLQYEMIFTGTATVSADKMQQARRFVRGRTRDIASFEVAF
jgi:hypothetical protein